jgi:pimeloyl-ACP methyl ester carboxylesterase
MQNDIDTPPLESKEQAMNPTVKASRVEAVSSRMRALGKKLAPLAAAPVIVQLCAASAMAQTFPFTTKFVQLQGGNSLAVLYEPTTPKSDVALIFSHPDRNNFTDAVAQQVASRGYRILMVDNRADGDSPDSPEESYLPSISLGIAYLRAVPMVRKVALIAHSGGTHLGTLYQNVAENGPSACSGPEKIYPCNPSGLGNLQKADALILLDPTLGAAHQMSAIDPSVANDDGTRPASPRIPPLDFLNPMNGFDNATKSATYSPTFVRRFYSMQSARNNDLIDEALKRLALIEAGKGNFSNDEPLTLRGVGVTALGARLYQPDTRFLARTKSPHLVLRANGSREVMIFNSVRNPSGNHAASLGVLGAMNYDTTVRGFLANSAVRTTADFAFTENDIVGVDWASSVTSTPSNAKGVRVPSLVMAMGCHYLMVPGEIIYNNLASADKTYVGVEGAVHGFTACRPEYGDTRKRVFDYVDEWVSKQ